MKCPECFSELTQTKRGEYGEQGVTHCEKCKVTWLIPQTKGVPKR